MVESFHGVEIVDEYRWLEDSSASDTQDWVVAQNTATRSVLDRFPDRKRVGDRLAGLLTVGSISAPIEAGGQLFYLCRLGEENQSRLMMQRRNPLPDGHATQSEQVGKEESAPSSRALVGPNEIDPSGMISIDWWYPSSDGRFVAFGLSAGGDEQSILYIVDSSSGDRLPDLIPGTRFSTVGWLPDASGFYYTRITDIGIKAELASDYYHRAVYLHRLGTSYEKDEEVFPDDGDPETQPSVFLSRNGRWLLVHVHRGWDQAHVYLRDLSQPRVGFLPITQGLSGLFNPHIVEDTLYLHTNYHAPHYRLMRVDLEELLDRQSRLSADFPASESPLVHLWAETVPEHADAVLKSFVVGRGGIVLHYLRDAQSRLVVMALNGDGSADIALPQTVSVTEMTGREDSYSIFCAWESFTTPSTICEYQLDTFQLSPWRSLKTDFVKWFIP